MKNRLKKTFALLLTLILLIGALPAGMLSAASDTTHAKVISANNIHSAAAAKAAKPDHIHIYSIKETDGCTVYSCDKCGKVVTYKEYPISLDTFARHFYGKNFNKLSGKISKKGSQKFNVAYKWLSYAAGFSNSYAQEVAKKFENKKNITIYDVKKLIAFMEKCNNLADLYGCTFAGSLSKILGKASICTVFLDPSSTTMDQYIAIVSYVNGGVGFLLETYATVGKGMVALCTFAQKDTYAQIFDQYWWDTFKINFEGPTPGLGSLNVKDFQPKASPTYRQLFDPYRGGKTRLDMFVTYLTGLTGFKELCQKYKENKYVIQYKYIMWWLVNPALEKEFAGCTQYGSIYDLIDGVAK